ncbi:TPA: DUF3592 domain-containing protein [Legionella pneumophila subsp. pneumophila]|nr:DUF3592 domain-containing protein [Legionella pneumophila]HAT8831282.1 DUF3592 domain-containing protein [Legionella pneumophila subsp. pneumophila]TIE28296.1 DUF3592 domain-containing protein [Legionella pneumophila]TIE49662.1 DUF3592 domain-containing protein [Legionella pneumophila]HAT8334957.1 DUF3592 domain-containing protein [Legionella pneumophila]
MGKNMVWPIIWRWILDLGWLCFLLILFWYFWKKRRDLVEARSWLKAKGHVTRCEWTRVGHSVWPRIEYIYEVYEKDLTGEYLFLDTTFNTPNSKYSRSIAYKVAIAYRDNSEIDVYYNPNRPEQSALDVTIPKKLTFILILISSLILLHIGIIVWSLLV